MQYQIIDKDGNIIAWIDTNKDNIICKDSYTILQGEDLNVTDIYGELKPVIRTIYMQMSNNS